LDGNYTVLTAIDDTFNVTETAFNFQGNQYKKMGDANLNNLCTLVYNENVREYFEDFQRHQKYPVEWKTCPYSTGPNEIKNYMIKDYADLLPPYVPWNEKWKVEIRFIDGEELLGGFNIYAILRNHNTLMMGGK
jgi:hypothetical protein